MFSRRDTLRTGAAGILALTAGCLEPLTANSAPGIDGPGLQRILDDFAGSAASAVLAEVRDCGQVWRGSSGVSELGSSRPVVAGGRFRAGSITKSFVATVVLQLAGER